MLFDTLASAAILVSPYKPVLAMLTFLPWAWLVSSKLEKDSRYYHLATEKWNAGFIASGIAAFAAVLFVPIFWIGWPVSILLLLGPILLYWKLRNAAVPEGQEFELGSESFKAAMEQRAAAKATKDAVLVFAGMKDGERPVPQKDDAAFLVHMSAEELLGPAIESRASSVEISVTREGAATAQTVDGIRFKREVLGTDAGMKLVDFIKECANLDLGDRRRRQRGMFKVRGPEGRNECTVTTAGSSNGLSMRIEMDREKQLSRPFDQLGLLPKQREQLDTLIPEDDRHGIVLIGAPSGQGLRTSMYSFLARHDAYTSNIKSLEREIELELDGVDHVEYDSGNREADYATQLQSILRRDPDVVQTGFVQDSETAKVITAPGMEGPLLYVPIRAGSIPDMVRQWVKLVGDTKEATSSLRGVVVQRLIRTLCPNCRQPYAPSPQQLAKLNLPADKVQQLYRPSGQVIVKDKPQTCPVCRGSGYLGQTGIFEVLMLDKPMRKALAGGDLKGVMAQARRNKMVYLQESAIRKVAEGETSLEEVARVTAAPKSGGGGKAPAPAAAAT